MKKISKILAAALCFCMAGSIGACHKTDETVVTDENHAVFETVTEDAKTIDLTTYEAVKPSDSMDWSAVAFTYNGKEISYPFSLSVFTDDGWVAENEDDGTFAGWYVNDKYGYALQLAGFSLPGYTVEAISAPEIVEKGVYCFTFTAVDSDRLDDHPTLTINGYDIFDKQIPSEFVNIGADIDKSEAEIPDGGVLYAHGYNIQDKWGLIEILQVAEVDNRNVTIAFEMAPERPIVDTDGIWFIGGGSESEDDLIVN